MWFASVYIDKHKNQSKSVDCVRHVDELVIYIFIFVGLRGASTLRWREGGRRYMLEYEELLARGARLVVFTPTGTWTNIRVNFKGYTISSKNLSRLKCLV